MKLNLARFCSIIFIGFLLGCQSASPTASTITSIVSAPAPTNKPRTITSAPLHSPVPSSTVTGIVASATSLPPMLEPSSSPTNLPETTDLPVPTPLAATPTGSSIIIDHRSIELFDQIPDTFLEAARNLHMVFTDFSVGNNIDQGLNCLAASTWAESRPGCRRDFVDSNWNYKLFFQSDLTAGNLPARIHFRPDPLVYNRDRWSFVLLRPGDWKSAGREFLEEIIPAYLDSKDVFSLQFGYYDVGPQGDIIDPEKGFFAESPERYEISDLLNFQTQHPDKKLVYWTTALSRSIGTQESTDFNNQLRRYVQEHDGILLDLADIESYNPEGIPCFDNRDGIPYCDQNTGKCENYPDDNKSFPAICQDYTTEVDAGHLGSVSAGKIRLAKAFWVLMARLAGWTPQL